MREAQVNREGQDMNVSCLMRYIASLNRGWTKWLIIGLVCGLGGFIATALAQTTKQMIVTPFQDARFVPLDAAQPEGSQLAVLWGDPAKGPSAMLVKFKKGVGRPHYHSSDYHLTLLQGTMKHWAEGEREEDAKPLGPGSYWFQPGSQVHTDACLTDECLMFVYWPDKRDTKLAETPRK
jgi:quercetin dioxygenase-like cupin family protein